VASLQTSTFTYPAKPVEDRALYDESREELSALDAPDCQFENTIND
jgi:hypothetical protein